MTGLLGYLTEQKKPKNAQTAVMTVKRMSSSVMANHLNFLLWFDCLFFQESGLHTWEKSQNVIRGINK